MKKLLALSTFALISATLAVHAETAPAAVKAAPATPPAVTAPAPVTTPAATTETGGVYRKACEADVQKFCGTVEKGKGQVRTCLESNASQLSAQCKEGLAARAAAAAAKGKS